MPWVPSGPNDFPTLGWTILDWMSEYLAAPDSPDGERFNPTPEQAKFILEFYELDPLTARRKIRRGVLSRPKGWGKSPLLAAIAAAEGLGPVVCDGWDADGQPVGRPWRDLRTPLVQLSAVSEDQTRNAWTPLLEMVSHPGAVDAFPGLEPLQTFITVPGGGRIEFVTASARSREGNRPVFCVLDQTETWTPNNGGVKLAATMRRNLGKTDGSSIESPNAYLPGEGSVAEMSAAYWQTIKEGKARDDGLLYDHREAPADVDLADHDSLLAGLRHAYGCSSSLPCVLPGHEHAAGWVNLERIIAEVWDPATDPQDARRYYLNQITHASDSYISQVEWAACVDEEAALAPRDLITLGFDGSRGRAEGKPDATALIATRVTDGFQHALGVWEAGDSHWDDWTPPLPEIDAAIAEAFKTYRIAAFYADPAKDWRSKVNEWEAAYARHLVPNAKGIRVMASRDHPFEWWMTGGRSVFIERAVRSYAAAIRNGEMSHTAQQAFTRHILNARRRISHQHLTIGKESNSSPNKVDACVSAILSWQGRLDCISAGISAAPPKRGRIQRIR